MQSTRKKTLIWFGLILVLIWGLNSYSRRWAQDASTTATPAAMDADHPHHHHHHREEMEQVDEQGSSSLVGYVKGRISSAAAAENKKDTIIITYVSYSYRIPLMNWLVSMNQLGLVPMIGIICLDESICHELKRIGMEGYVLIDSQSNTNERLSFAKVQNLWVTRMKHLHELISAGIHVTFSDSDAIWLRDPFKEGIFSESKGDIVGGKGAFPWDVARHWGTTICMGVVYVRSTPATKIFIERAYLETKKTNDDQIGLNIVLQSLLSPDPVKIFGRRLRSDGASDVSVIVPILNKDQLRLSFRFTLISHLSIPRWCNILSNEQWKSKVIIAHCHPADGHVASTQMQKGNNETHSQVLHQYGLYHLVDDWETKKTKNGENTIEQFLTLIFH